MRKPRCFSICLLALMCLCLTAAAEEAGFSVYTETPQVTRPYYDLNSIDIALFKIRASEEIEAEVIWSCEQIKGKKIPIYIDDFDYYGGAYLCAGKVMPVGSYSFEVTATNEKRGLKSSATVDVEITKAIKRIPKSIKYPDVEKKLILLKPGESITLSPKVSPSDYQLPPDSKFILTHEETDIVTVEQDPVTGKPRSNLMPIR